MSRHIRFAGARQPPRPTGPQLLAHYKLARGLHGLGDGEDDGSSSSSSSSAAVSGVDVFGGDAPGSQTATPSDALQPALSLPSPTGSAPSDLTTSGPDAIQLVDTSPLANTFGALFNNISSALTGKPAGGSASGGGGGAPSITIKIQPATAATPASTAGFTSNPALMLLAGAGTLLLMSAAFSGKRGGRR